MHWDNSHRGTEGREARKVAWEPREQGCSLSVPAWTVLSVGVRVMCAAKKVGTGVWDSNLLPVFWIVGRMEPKRNREVCDGSSPGGGARKQREELQQQVGPWDATRISPSQD